MGLFGAIFSQTKFSEMKNTYGDADTKDSTEIKLENKLSKQAELIAAFEENEKAHWILNRQMTAELATLRAKVEILQGAYDTAKDHANALNAENAQLIEDKKNLNITIENAAEWSQKQSDEIEKLSEALKRCQKWFFQHAPTAVLPDGTGQEAHREITDVLFRAEIPANEF